MIRGRDWNDVATGHGMFATTLSPSKLKQIIANDGGLLWVVAPIVVAIPNVMFLQQ